MSTARRHYDEHLAPHYSWLFGDFQARVAAERRWFESSGIAPRGSGVAVDLGAGPGFQSIALADLGFRVVALDLCGALLDEMAAHAGDRPIERVQADIAEFRAHAPAAVEVVACRGDTLTHLSSLEAVAALLRQAAAALEPRGSLALSFRDLTAEARDLDRFIPVRADPDRIFTCFLEYEPEHVKVHDLVYLREGDGWALRKSWYRKVRIAPGWLADRLRQAGLRIRAMEAERGMVTVLAERP